MLNSHSQFPNSLRIQQVDIESYIVTSHASKMINLKMLVPNEMRIQQASKTTQSQGSWDDFHTEEQ